ncbi:MAG: TonB-dependent receptor, partial [Candidatus Hydrogenedentes bacterium]|nr:TonB-dependent receptor [Candidatus Hydrogenedentota bacterium]
VRELSAALYAESRLRWTDASELLFGLRSDHYRFKTSAAAGEAWSGTVNDTLASPKVGLTHKLAPNVAVYANWGRGFHSNDARGVTSPDSPAPGLVPSTGSELGLRYERDRFNMTATLWRMSVSSDLIFVGDSGAVEPAGATRRSGYEVALFWRALPWLTLDANWTGSHARFTNSPGA